MGALFACVLLTAAALLAWWVPRRRLARALARPLAPAQLAIVERNVAQYRGMPAPLQLQLQQRVKQFLHQKRFVGCAGLEVTDEMRLTIAAQACLLLLNRSTGVYPGLRTVLVYPGAFLVPRRQQDEAGVISETRHDLLGESWSDGRVILSWEHVRRAGVADDDDGQGTHNVVLHEFAHQLDSESGGNNGAPLLGSAARYRRWSETLSRDFEQLRRDTWFGFRDVLDPYGASSPAEFFAVATETFFEQPHALAERHPELYAEFQAYYRVDPRAWFTQPWMEPAHAGVVYGQWR